MEPLAADDPRQVGMYRLQFRLGAGGMGRVFLGFSPAGRAVAVKIVHPELARDPEFIQRFRREVRAAEAVSGAYTAPVVAAGPDDDPPWLATAFVAGPSLADLVGQMGPLPEAAVWRLAGGLVEALQAVHARGLVHRDLKPTNVLLAADGPRVIDFGISRALAGTVVTASSVIMGTPGFMSPEQAQGLPVGLPSDVFALGGVIAFAATGAAPFGSGDLVATAYRIVHAQPDLGGMPVTLRNLVASCLAKAPADRPSLTRLLEAVMTETAFHPSVSPADFWPEPVAGLISSRQDSFRIQVAPRGESGPVAAMSPPPDEPLAPASAGPSESSQEATRTAASFPSIRADPAVDRPGSSARESISAIPGSIWPAGSSAITRVPRTEAERQQLLRERPIGWEFLYFAARLLHERNSVEDRYRDFLMGYAPPTGEIVSRQDAAAYILSALQDTQRVAEDAPRIMSSDAQERAFGPPGVEGDPEALEYLAKRFNGIYESLIDWIAKLRGASMPSEYGKAIELLALINDNAVSEYRRFVDDIVAHNDRLPAQIAAGNVEKRDFTLRLTMHDEAIKAFVAELRRLGEEVGISGSPGRDGDPRVHSEPRYVAVMQVGERTFELGRYHARVLAIGACQKCPEWQDAQWVNVNDTEAVAAFRQADGTEVTFAVMDQERRKSIRKDSP